MPAALGGAWKTRKVCDDCQTRANEVADRLINGDPLVRFLRSSYQVSDRRGVVPPAPRYKVSVDSPDARAAVLLTLESEGTSLQSAMSAATPPCSGLRARPTTKKLASETSSATMSAGCSTTRASLPEQSRPSARRRMHGRASWPSSPSPVDARPTGTSGLTARMHKFSALTCAQTHHRVSAISGSITRPSVRPGRSCRPNTSCGLKTSRTWRSFTSCCSARCSEPSLSTRRRRRRSTPPGASTRRPRVQPLVLPCHLARDGGRSRIEDGAAVPDRARRATVPLRGGRARWTYGHAGPDDSCRLSGRRPQHPRPTRRRAPDRARRQPAGVSAAEHEDQQDEAKRALSIRLEAQVQALLRLAASLRRRRGASSRRLAGLARRFVPEHGLLSVWKYVCETPGSRARAAAGRQDQSMTPSRHIPLAVAVAPTRNAGRHR